MNLVLPTAKVEASNQNPRKILLFAHQKTGKTSAVLQLDKCLLVDLENSAEFYGGLFVNVKKIAQAQKISLFEAFKQVIKALKEDVAKNGIYYKYIAIDSMTILEDLAKELALVMYKNSEIGKNYKETDIFKLPNGSAELWFRNAAEQLYNSFEGLYSDCLILIAHVKSSSITKNGVDLQVRDVNLRGKFKLLVGAEVDAIAYMYRNKGEKVNIISFVGDERDMVTGARPAHLANKEFPISEILPSGEFVTYWDRVFLK
jgi:riboflavin synthase alpha subunit